MTKRNRPPIGLRGGSVTLFLVVVFTLTLALSMGSALTVAQGGAIRPGFNANVLPANDDASTDLVPLGFTINFFGVNYTHLYINNNGNVTFDEALAEYTPFNLTTTGRVIMAPFFADVDTTGTGSGEVTYGPGTVNGRPAFGVNWINVGYFDANTDKLNSFQLVIIDRSDIAPGDFDLEFNYDKIQWETGDLNGGTNGLGGNSARVGYSNGTGQPGTFFEMPGSGVPGSFLDSNTATGLIHNSMNSTQPGRYVFHVRSGLVEPTPTPTSTPTPTVTPTGTTATPTPTPVRNFRFWGQVQDLSGHPMGNVAVHLLARKANTDWQLVKAVNTHGNGQYFLFRWEDKGYTHYRIVVRPPSGYVPVRAEAPAPAQIIDAQTIQYVSPASGYYLNNNFILGVPTPTPTATPTHTPSPTPTDTPTPTPTHTPTPTPTPTPSTGSVQGYVWRDDNMDGQRQEGEKGVPNITVRLSEQTYVQALAARETTTDATGFYRFTDIPPGTYILSLVSQVGLYPTTETIVEVKAAANTVVEMDFGVYSLPKHIYMPLMMR